MDETCLINRKNIVVAIPIRGLITRNMTKTATEDVKGAEKENPTATERELKKEKEGEVQTEVQAIPEVEVRFKEEGPQRILVQDLQNEDSILRPK